SLTRPEPKPFSRSLPHLTIALLRKPSLGFPESRSRKRSETTNPRRPLSLVLGSCPGALRVVIGGAAVVTIYVTPSRRHRGAPLRGGKFRVQGMPRPRLLPAAATTAA
ncbi:unnamed protein product, partial [Ectocarpus sp. 12 AP-2014]